MVKRRRQSSLIINWTHRSLTGSVVWIWELPIDLREVSDECLQRTAPCESDCSCFFTRHSSFSDIIMFLQLTNGVQCYYHCLTSTALSFWSPWLVILQMFLHFQSTLRLSCRLAVHLEHWHTRHVPGGSITEKTSCQANMTDDNSDCWGWWIVYYLPAVKQQTSICSCTVNQL